MSCRSFMLVIIATIVSTLGGREEVLAAAGKLDRPEIAVPPEDQTAGDLREALLAHRHLFAGGSYINAHSTLNFKGDARNLSRMLEKLSAVEGATVSIRFSQNVMRENQKAVVKYNKPIEEGCQWSIEHHGWGDAGRLTVTILLGEGGVDLDELELPVIRGRKPSSTPDTGIPGKDP